MCYERRRAEACVDESAHHALGLGVARATWLVGQTAASYQFGAVAEGVRALRRQVDGTIWFGGKLLLGIFLGPGLFKVGL